MIFDRWFKGESQCSIARSLGRGHTSMQGVLSRTGGIRPVVEAYSHLLTTEERALTLVETGSDFDYEQGVGALDFGMYVAPRFY